MWETRKKVEWSGVEKSGNVTYLSTLTTILKVLSWKTRLLYVISLGIGERIAGFIVGMILWSLRVNDKSFMYYRHSEANQYWYDNWLPPLVHFVVTTTYHQVDMVTCALIRKSNEDLVKEVNPTHKLSYNNKLQYQYTRMMVW